MKLRQIVINDPPFTLCRHLIERQPDIDRFPDLNMELQGDVVRCEYRGVVQYIPIYEVRSYTPTTTSSPKRPAGGGTKKR